ncbi:MAG: hypothetical protein H6740_28995 [Alphaproteobacteria bacterium]|nr:hypothetical protein [Alphaproteobacteria bacterium]
MQLLWLALACTGGADVSAPAPHPLDASWLGRLADKPELFSQTVDAEREGWIALHANDLDRALQGDGAPDARAKLELAALHADLARLQQIAWSQTLEAWQQRSALPDSPGLAWTAALMQIDAGDWEAADGWLKKAAAGKDPMVAQAAQALLDGTPGAPVELREANPLIERYNVHLAARADGEAMHPAVMKAHEPLLVEAGDKAERRWYDPQVYTSIATGWRGSLYSWASPTEAQLFTPCLVTAPTPAPLEGQVLYGDCLAPSGEALGVTLELSGPDDPEAARVLARALDAALDPWLATRVATASEDGAALLRDLDLGAKLRAGLLLTLAREALGDERPRQAEALALMALDAEQGRRVGPVNHPGLFAVLAEARLRTGHVREALDDLQVLVEVRPEVTGLDELVGDLAILRGLDRVGDSKEN